MMVLWVDVVPPLQHHASCGLTIPLTCVFPLTLVSSRSPTDVSFTFVPSLPAFSTASLVCTTVIVFLFFDAGFICHRIPVHEIS